MIEQTFLHMTGVGHATEQRLWRNGFQSWDHLWEALNSGWSASDVLRDRRVQRRLFDDNGSREKNRKTLAWLGCLDASRKSWKEREYRFFTDLLRPSDHWRLLASVWKEALFLDIETTGLSSELHYTTVIGAFYQGEFHQWVWPQPLEQLRDLLKSASILVTFNGRRFDVPFLQEHVPELQFPDAHIDLLYIANAASLKGGQKAVEENLGLNRNREIRELNGKQAVLSWCSGLYGDKKAYQQLLKYNRADVELMPQLAQLLCAKLAANAEDVLKEPRIAATVHTKWGHKPSNYASLQKSWKQHRPGLHLLEPKLLRRFERPPKIVGIDLRGKPENPTGWAICEGSSAETCILYGDEEILSKTLAVKPDLVSIDAPLALPRGRKSAFDDSPCRKEWGIVRDAERILWARGVGVYPALIPHMQKLTARGMRLAQELESRGLKVIESYPGAAQDVLGIPRKRANEDLLSRGLQEFGFDFAGDKSHDELDAITSALVGYFYLADEYEAIGADDECYMIIPKWNSMSWSGNKCPKVVSLVGLPGSGKTTLARALAERLGWRVVILGELLRERAKDDQLLAEQLRRGEFAPEELVEEIIMGELASRDEEGLVLDGFPRHARQAETARQLFPEWKVVYLDIPLDTARSRLLARRKIDRPENRAEDEPDAIEHRFASALPAVQEVLKTVPKSNVLTLDASLSAAELACRAVSELLCTRFG